MDTKKKFAFVLILILCVSFLFSQKEAKRGKYQIELFGGFLSVNPSDLNLKIVRAEEFDEFFVDRFYVYLRDAGIISSFHRMREGEYKKISNLVGKLL